MIHAQTRPTDGTTRRAGKSTLKSWTACAAAGSVMAMLAMGCATTKVDPAYVQTLRESGKLTLANYSSGHISGPGILVEGPASLDVKCLAGIEEVLLAAKPFDYVARSAVGISGKGPEAAQYFALRDKYGISAILKAKLTFQVSPGFKKLPALAVDWEVLAPDGTRKIRIKTAATADKTGGVFLNTFHPGHEPTYVELARRNAAQFLEKLSLM